MKYFLLLLSLLLLNACASTIGPQSSGVETPSLWHQMSGRGDKGDRHVQLMSSPGAQVEQVWWQHFRDPTLDALISEALANNKTLAVAKARVEEARADRKLARAQQMPEITGVADVTRGNQGLLTSGQSVYITDASIEASWELDLFGQNKDRANEAQAILSSEDAARQGVMVGLLAEVARNYFDLRNDEHQIALTKDNLATQQKTYDLIQAQFQGDLASGFDVQRAGAQVSTTAAIIPMLESARDAALNRLNVLLGHPPGTQDAMLNTANDLAPLDPHILVAAPATVLATRPDVRAAERNFAASIAAKKAANADLFPKITLTALFGVQDSSLLSSTLWGIGAGLVQPILNFGRIESQIDASDARQKQAFYSYQETVLEALENMEDSLSGYLHEASRNAFLTAAVTENRKATDLAQQQYTSGFTGLLDVLVVQRNLLDAESSQVASAYSLRKDLVNIYAAAGGGWQE